MKKIYKCTIVLFAVLLILLNIASAREAISNNEANEKIVTFSVCSSEDEDDGHIG